MYPENPFEMFLQSFSSRMEKNVWWDGEKSWMGGDWLRQVDRWTQVFQRKHVAPDQIVVISLPPSLEVCTAVLALWRLRATVFLVPTELPVQDIVGWSQSAGSTGGVVSPAVAEQLYSQRDTLGWNWGLVSGASSVAVEWDNVEAPFPQTRNGESAQAAVAWDPSRRAMLSLSSGTWQPPVGVLLTQDQIWHTVWDVKEAWSQTVKEPTGAILDLPLCSSWLTTSLAILWTGQTVHNQTRMSWSTLVHTASACITPVICLTTAHHARDWLASSSKAESSASQTPPPATLRWIWALGGFLPSPEKTKNWPVPLYSAYKIEACGGVIAWATAPQAGVGKVFSGITPRVEREPHKHRKPGDPLRGEVLLEGTQVSTLRLDMESRWFHVECRYPGCLSTGDWGILDRHQHLHIEGHLEDMVEYRDSFFSIQPIEQKLREHRQVQAAVLRVLERNGPLKAFLELDPDAPGTPLSSRTVLTYIQEHFPHYMLPKYVEFREKLPRNVYGEVARWALR